MHLQLATCTSSDTTVSSRYQIKTGPSLMIKQKNVTWLPIKVNLYMLWLMQKRKRYGHAMLSSWKEMLSTETMMNPRSSNSQSGVSAHRRGGRDRSWSRRKDKEMNQVWSMGKWPCQTVWTTHGPKWEGLDHKGQMWLQTSKFPNPTQTPSIPQKGHVRKKQWTMKLPSWRKWILGLRLRPRMYHVMPRSNQGCGSTSWRT